ncbi:tetratricopeptide repeat protein [Sulfurimonas sp.]|uniref:tetratricopeptide repeat protein n=1 Tax=Sulfurimonas sp. TaxID=2022749 RepID=UPI003569CBA9
MAEELEEIIIIEDDDVAKEDELSTPDDSDKKKKIIIFSAISAVLIVIIILSLVVALSSEKKDITQYNLDSIETRLDKDKQKKQSAEITKLENMIAKAAYLYENGSQAKALHLYEKIAQYSESISQYNLGVAQLKNKQYDTALQTFAKAIENGEKRCVSAINAAVCSLHLKDEKRFNYYIDLAYAFLPNESSSPLYSYYYSLVQYYKQNYLEALSALNNPTTKEYPNIQKHLSAKINALYDNNYVAIEKLENKYNKKDSLSLGLLYARIGDLPLAQKYLQEAMSNNIEPVKSAVALSYIYLKTGKITSAGKMIQNTTDMFPAEVYKPYPLKVKLKDELFDPQKAQISYIDDLKNSLLVKYSKIFYFSPYKIFNANATIDYIRKGNTNIYIDNVDSAKKYLQKSKSTSSVNKGIIQAIKLALSFDIRDANSKLKQLVKLQPKHSILHYNLALTYAQMGDIKNAYEHFKKSFHLDAKNYASGIYASMCAQLLDIDDKKLVNVLKESMILENDSEDMQFYRTLMFISENNSISAAEWLYNNYKQRPIYIALQAIIASDVGNERLLKQAVTNLVALFPNDILPHIMYTDAYYSDLKTKKYSFEVQNYYREQKFDYKDLFYGPFITRHLYAQQALITGNLYFVRKLLRDELETTQKYTHELTSALALTSLYDKAYEESYVLYNNLIDGLKVTDSYTLYLGAVASTAADHSANAIALLELSKMKNKTFKESRYALGLLYLQTQNNEGASIQLKTIGDSGFKSKYFTFDIDADKLYTQKVLAKKDKQ